MILKLGDVMLGDVLGVAIGIFFIYLILSLLLSAFVEWLSRHFGWRAQRLKRWLEQLLDVSPSSRLSLEFYKHPLIKPLVGEGKLRIPPSIPPRWFSIVLVDTIKGKDTRFPESVADLKRVIAESEKCPESTKQALERIVEQAGVSLKDALDGIGIWFEETMQSMRQAYKAAIQQRIFVVALVLAAFLNIDTIGICSTLWKDSHVREAMSVVAERFLAEVEGKPAQEINSQTLAAAKAIMEMSSFNLPIWWSLDRLDPRHLPRSPSDWILKILGLGATAVATSLGAPFWFDILRKLIGLRTKSSPITA